MGPIKTKISLILLGIVFASCGIDSENHVVKDPDDNNYPTIEIGKQVWMAADLKTTRFNDGEPIPLIEEYEAWSEGNSPAFCWYNNDSINGQQFGALYNWYAVNTGKLCPEGWHVPSDDEWNELWSHIMRLELTAGSLKEESSNYWKKSNEEATNETGFTALPTGYRSYNGTFNLQRAGVFWWTSTKSNWSRLDSIAEVVFYRNLRYNSQNLHRNISEINNGFCVRCVKDTDSLGE